ncbi:uncharacterized protein LOC18422996 [Amborella trichopoda]|uniref:DUF4378 domain-containing protein n=1 Tax=Amborella trichopoda TaxID=13333 RepID=W1NHN5_AMBTC|nr:uncharacterized protein LOC18422996 [Amborella trichopoda]XP_020526341.1 uncharacterized protein LOC18422996 [Amborella trichopoda]ERM95013.1 hypothetical protein AMTR_s00009p00237790 [Amborella trichopoda]|eukprot:XP_006827597.1 uncharacterized protein LOC18422996 [Amborella trichopoda]
MAKISQQRRSIRTEKDHPGCIWGLLSIFDTRHSHSIRRLIADRRHGSARYAIGNRYSKSTLNMLPGVDKKQETIDSGVPVNKKTEENVPMKVNEAIKENHSKKQINSALACGLIPDPRLGSHLEVNHANHHDGLDKQLIEKQVLLQEKLGEAAEAFLNQKFMDATKDGTTPHPKELLDALEILNSNKELFLKLLQDPDSVLVKHIQALRNAQTKKSKRNSSKSLEESKLSELLLSENVEPVELPNERKHQKPSGHKSFRKREKAKSGDPLREKSEGLHSMPNGPQISTRIVLLKPSLATAHQDAVGSNPSSSHKTECELLGKGAGFSLKEIKQRIKHAIGDNKKGPWLSMDGFLHRAPYGAKHLKQLDSTVAMDVERTTETDITSGNSGDSERNSKTTTPTSRRERGGKLKLNQVHLKTDSLHSLYLNGLGTSSLTLSPVSREARKHLRERLSSENEEDMQSPKQAPRTLGRILDLPEYNALSPRLIAIRERKPYNTSDYESESALQQVHWNMDLSEEMSRVSNSGIESSTIVDKVSSNCIRPDLQSSPRTPKELGSERKDEGIPSVEDLFPSADNEISDLDHMERTEGSDVLHVTEEPESIGTTSENTKENLLTDTTENCALERVLEARESSCKCSHFDLQKNNIEEVPLLETTVVKSPSSSPTRYFSSSYSLIHEAEALESICEKPELPSPISVLDPSFHEDVLSPASSLSPRQVRIIDERQTPSRFAEELHIEPRRIQFKEPKSYRDPKISIERNAAIFEYVSDVLEASGFSKGGFQESWHSSDEPLDFSLFNEVAYPSCQIHEDQRHLIFDCINEVLVELYKRYFGYSLWFSLSRNNIRPIPTSKHVLEEVWTGIRWHLQSEILPNTLDSLSKRDLERREGWMDLGVDIEQLIIEIEEEIFEDLIDEAVFGDLLEEASSDTW